MTYLEYLQKQYDWLCREKPLLTARHESKIHDHNNTIQGATPEEVEVLMTLMDEEAEQYASDAHTLIVRIARFEELIYQAQAE